MVLRFSASLLARLKRMYEIYLQTPKPIRRLEVIFCVPIVHYVWGSIACDMPVGFYKLYLSKSCSRRTSTSELALQLIKSYILLHGRGWEWAPYYHLWWTWRNLQGEFRPIIVLEGMKFTYMRWITELTFRIWHLIKLYFCKYGHWCPDWFFCHVTSRLEVLHEMGQACMIVL
jgi:hypothetical protein